MHLSRAITLLHISDAQFGRNHRFGRLGLPAPDAPFDTLFARLCDDLRLLKDEHGLVPDLVIASGDLAEWGKKKEFDDILDLLTRLTEVLGLPRERVVIVPGNHDINRKSCEAYFTKCEADDQPPVAPFWPKWEYFHRMVRAFYGDAAIIQFTPDEPWSWYEYDDLKLVVAGLNSTMAESHLEKDHYGYLGEKQLRWFADKLRAYKGEGWFRLGIMHHNQQRGVPSDDESLHDADDLRRHLGGYLNLLLHGHTHEGKVHWLDRDVPILSTGSAAVTAPARTEEVPNQYQVLRLHPDRIERYTRCYDPGQKRWIGENRASEHGDRWITEIQSNFRPSPVYFPWALQLSQKRMQSAATGCHARAATSTARSAACPRQVVFSYAAMIPPVRRARRCHRGASLATPGTRHSTKTGCGNSPRFCAKTASMPFWTSSI